MRVAFLIAAAAVGLAGCGSDQSANTVNAGEDLTAANLVVNDITAIDAVTAQAANMAADIDYTEALENETGNTTGSRELRRPETERRRPAPTPQENEPAAASDSDSPEAAASNATE